MNKSEELAKLLGIDVMYYAGIGGVYNKERYIAVFGKDAFNRQIMEYDDNEYTVKLIYPDFTKPNNFVKLLEMPNILINSADFESYIQKDYVGCLGEALLSFGFSICDRDSFINALITCINESYFEDIDDIKSKIQQTEWEY